MARGVLTKEVQAVAMEHLGREITRLELRLMAYVQYTWMNSVPVGRERINRDENGVLNEWKNDSHVILDSDLKGRRVYPTEKFYRAVSEILMVGYCSEWIAP